jgi:hypothetical protein
MKSHRDPDEVSATRSERARGPHRREEPQPLPNDWTPSFMLASEVKDRGFDLGRSSPSTATPRPGASSSAGPTRASGAGSTRPSSGARCAAARRVGAASIKALFSGPRRAWFEEGPAVRFPLREEQ